MARRPVGAAALGALLALLAALLAPLSPASAASPGLARPAAGSPGFCPDASGVTVVVDFRELGGGRVVRCAHGPQADGLAALRNAGFTVAGTNRWGDAFICRINGRPGVDSEPCVDTPPSTAYWSYWHAGNGENWTYSQRGATYRTPPEGSFDGWSFSLNQEEGTAPAPGLAAQRPSDGGGSGDSGGQGGSPGGGDGGAGGDANSGSDQGGSAPGGPGGAGGDSGASGSGADPGDRPDGPGAATAGEEGDSGTPDGQDAAEEEEHDAEGEEEPAEEPDEDTDDGRDAEAAPMPTEDAEWSGADEEFEEESAARDDSGGPSAGTVATLGLLVALLGAGGLTAWRRRRATAVAGASAPDDERPADER
ncbi:MYXO-CTERM domain-containing protein [Streptomyces zhaozhouensis]|uniref:MYXO-CTERM domain-containing protein n=1 Tax=Streptomyces zhaozhouensis TaxID=1300267 RepID=A0A286DXN8_9ACTN|nr:hypothetical protein [Streptomyces zhaozhouensis]SOD63314.1 MYXO-CTERM domain-containing protein [Streptomyces zhaozhouensis]